jgi:hypothetical protein
VMGTKIRLRGIPETCAGAKFSAGLAATAELSVVDGGEEALLVMGTKIRPRGIPGTCARAKFSTGLAATAELSVVDGWRHCW